MTTASAAAAYLGEHLAEWNGRALAVFNPHSKPLQELPVIYGFNNGGERDWWSGQLLAQDGTALGGHVCSHEGYMPSDLGCLEGSRPDRHEAFQQHYPDGYRMEFVSLAEMKAGHPGVLAAYELNQKQAAEAAA